MRSAAAAVDPGESLHHLGRRAEHRLAVAASLALAPVERRAAADRDERVLQQRPARRVRVDVSRRDRLDPEVLREMAKRRVTPRIPSLVRSLELDEEALAAERGGEPRGAVLVVEREAVTCTAREADEALVQLCDRLEGDCGLEQNSSCSPREPPVPRPPGPCRGRGFPAGRVPAWAVVRMRQRFA